MFVFGIIKVFVFYIIFKKIISINNNNNNIFHSGKYAFKKGPVTDVDFLIEDIVTHILEIITSDVGK